ncbi:MAG: hypothetical protein ACLTDS_05830 [Bianqueaceae bacterium]
MESIETIFGPRDQREASLRGNAGTAGHLDSKGRISTLMPVLEEYGRLVMEFRREVGACPYSGGALGGRGAKNSGGPLPIAS